MGEAKALYIFCIVAFKLSGWCCKSSGSGVVLNYTTKDEPQPGPILFIYKETKTWRRDHPTSNSKRKICSQCPGMCLHSFTIKSFLYPTLGTECYITTSMLCISYYLAYALCYVLPHLHPHPLSCAIADKRYVYIKPLILWFPFKYPLIQITLCPLENVQF